MAKAKARSAATAAAMAASSAAAAAGASRCRNARLLASYAVDIAEQALALGAGL